MPYENRQITCSLEQALKIERTTLLSRCETFERIPENVKLSLNSKMNLETLTDITRKLKRHVGEIEKDCSRYIN